ncbi:MAG: (d)CMP kinase [Eubacteriales bacterium]|nr:(d)CMP kinase [bacterium]MDY2791672.1 (d)CMP kinase [Eubacteriales bacterium]
MNEHPITIAIDGPVGAGKSCIAALVAKRLGILYLDTGAMYRAVGLYMLRNGVDPHDAINVAKRAPLVHVDVRYEDGEQRVLLGGEDVSEAIRNNEVSMAASAVSAVAVVRHLMVSRQQEIARARSLVMDGRDIGTCVLPEATLKVYLTADAEERARRRCQQLAQKGVDVPLEQVLSELKARDHADMTRVVSPLRQADDAVLIDSTSLTVEQVVDRILALLDEKTHA